MTWQVGDLAMRVAPTNHGGYFGPKEGHELPQQGKVYRVEGVAIHPFTGHIGLILEGAHSAHPIAPAWRAASFRKVVQDKHEACEEEFVTLLRKSKAPAKLDALLGRLTLREVGK